MGTVNWEEEFNWCPAVTLISAPEEEKTRDRCIMATNYSPYVNPEMIPSDILTLDFVRSVVGNGVYFLRLLPTEEHSLDLYLTILECDCVGKLASKNEDLLRYFIKSLCNKKMCIKLLHSCWKHSGMHAITNTLYICEFMASTGNEYCIELANHFGAIWREFQETYGDPPRYRHRHRESYRLFYDKMEDLVVRCIQETTGA